MENGSKLPTSLNDPVDEGILKYIIDPLNPILYTLGCTPNILTAISGIIGLIGIYFIYHSNYILGSIFIFISYIFDCFDGNFARKYNMVTDFGDWFDHIKDWVVLFLLIIVLYTKKDITVRFKVITFILFVVLSLLTGLYLGEQDIYYNSENNGVEKSKFLEFFYNILDKILNTKSKPEQKLKYFRFFGPGVLNVYILLVLILCQINKAKV
jgi:hypothetical protein